MIEQCIYSRADAGYINANGQQIRAGYGRIAYTLGYPDFGGIPDQFVASYRNDIPDASGKMPSVFSMFEVDTNAGLTHVLQLNTPPLHGDASSAHIAHQYVASGDESITAMIRNPFDWMQIHFQKERKIPIQRVLVPTEKLQPEHRFVPGTLSEVLQYFGMAWQTFEMLLSSLFVSVNSATTATIVLVDDKRPDYETWVRRLIVHIYLFLPFEMRRKAGFETWCTGKLYSGSVNLCFASKRMLMQKNGSYYLLLDPRGGRVFDVTEMPVFNGNQYMFKGSIVQGNDFRNECSYKAFIRPWLGAALNPQSGLQAESTLNGKYWEMYDTMPAGRQIPSLNGFDKLIEYRRLYEGGVLPAPSEFKDYASPFCVETGLLGRKIFLHRLKQVVDSYEANEELVDNLMVLMDTEVFGIDLAEFALNRIKGYLAKVHVMPEKLLMLMRMNGRNGISIESETLNALVDHARWDNDIWKNAAVCCEILEMNNLERSVLHHVLDVSTQMVPQAFTPGKIVHDVLQQYLMLPEAQFRNAWACQYLKGVLAGNEWLQTELPEIMQACQDPQVTQDCFAVADAYLSQHEMVLDLQDGVDVLTVMCCEFREKTATEKLAVECVGRMRRFEEADETQVQEIRETVDRLCTLIDKFELSNAVREAGIEWALGNSCVGITEQLCMASKLIREPFDCAAMCDFLRIQEQAALGLDETRELMNFYPKLRFTPDQLALVRGVVLSGLQAPDLVLSIQDVEDVFSGICVQFEAEDAENLCIECIHRVDRTVEADDALMEKMRKLIRMLRELILEYEFSDVVTEAITEWVLQCKKIPTAERLCMVSDPDRKPYDSQALNTFLSEAEKADLNLEEGQDLMRIYHELNFTPEQQVGVMQMILPVLEKASLNAGNGKALIEAVKAMPEGERDNCAVALMGSMPFENVEDSLIWLEELLICARLNSHALEAAASVLRRMLKEPVTLAMMRHTARIAEFYADHAEVFASVWTDMTSRLSIAKEDMFESLNALLEGETLTAQLRKLPGEFSAQFRAMIDREISRHSYTVDEACKISRILMKAFERDAGGMLSRLFKNAQGGDDQNANAVALFLNEAAELEGLISDELLTECARLMKNGAVDSFVLKTLLKHGMDRKFNVNSEFAACLADCLAKLECALTVSLDLIMQNGWINCFADKSAQWAAARLIDQNGVRLQNILDFGARTEYTSNPLYSEILSAMLEKLGRTPEDELNDRQLTEYLQYMSIEGEIGKVAREGYCSMMQNAHVRSLDRFVDRMHGVAIPDADALLAMALNALDYRVGRWMISETLHNLDVILTWKDLDESWTETRTALMQMIAKILDYVKLYTLLTSAEEEYSDSMRSMILDEAERKAEKMQMVLKEEDVSTRFLREYYGAEDKQSPGTTLPQAICCAERIFREQPQREGVMLVLISCMGEVQFENPYEALIKALQAAADRAKSLDKDCVVSTAWTQAMSRTANRLIADERFQFPPQEDIYEAFVELVICAQANGLDMNEAVYAKALRMISESGFLDFRSERQKILAHYINHTSGETRKLAFDMFCDVTLNKLVESYRKKKSVEFSRLQRYAAMLQEDRMKVRLIAMTVFGLQREQIVLNVKEYVKFCYNLLEKDDTKQLNYTQTCAEFTSAACHHLKDAEVDKWLFDLGVSYRRRMAEEILNEPMMEFILREIASDSELNATVCERMFTAILDTRRIKSFIDELRTHGKEMTAETVLDPQVGEGIRSVTEETPVLICIYLHWRLTMLCGYRKAWMSNKAWMQPCQTFFGIKSIGRTLEGLAALSDASNGRFKEMIDANICTTCQIYMDLVRQGKVDYFLYYPLEETKTVSDFAGVKQIDEFTLWCATSYLASGKNEEVMIQLIREYRKLVPDQQFERFKTEWHMLKKMFFVKK